MEGKRRIKTVPGTGYRLVKELLFFYRCRIFVSQARRLSSASLV